MKVGFVCTNYNGSAYTRSAVASLLDAPRGGDVHVVVVDNSSTPEDIAALRDIVQEYPSVDLVLNPVNIGYFAGLNVGIRRLRERVPTIEHVVVGNNDLVFPPALVDSLEALSEIFDAWPVVAPDLVTPDGLHQNPHVAHPISRFRKLIWDLYYGSYPAAQVILRAARLTSGFTTRPERAPDSELFRVAGPIEMGLGACYVLGPVFFRNFSQLCAPTLLMQEEFFLAEQLKSIGKTTYYEPRIVIQHRDHGTMNLIPGRQNWLISRRAHQVYKQYLSMTPEQQANFMARSAGIARPLGGS